MVEMYLINVQIMDLTLCFYSRFIFLDFTSLRGNTVTEDSKFYVVHYFVKSTKSEVMKCCGIQENVINEAVNVKYSQSLSS